MDDLLANWQRKEMPGIPASINALWTQKVDGQYRYGLLVDDTHVNAQGFIHGGVLMTFLDHALSLKVWEAAERKPCTTIQLDTHFLSAVRPGQFITLEAQLLKQGKSLVFMRGVLMAADKAVAEAKGVWSVLG